MYDIIDRSSDRSSGCGAVWLARYLGVVEAVGSNPATPTKRILRIIVVFEVFRNDDYFCFIQKLCLNCVYGVFYLNV